WLRIPRVLEGVVAVGAGVALIVLVVEPFPIPASPRDQIRASNAIQAMRQRHRADVVLTDALRDLLPDNSRSIVITPERPANFVIEDVPFTFITGGRASGNVTYRPTRRFLSDRLNGQYWLDT